VGKWQAHCVEIDATFINPEIDIHKTINIHEQCHVKRMETNFSETIVHRHVYQNFALF